MLLRRKALAGLSSLVLLCNLMVPVWAAPGSKQGEPIRLIPPPPEVAPAPSSPTETQPAAEASPAQAKHRFRPTRIQPPSTFKQPAQTPGTVKKEPAPASGTAKKEPAPAPGTVKKEPLPPAPVELTDSRMDYRLGPGDQLSVTDPSLGSEEKPLETELTVGPDGAISFYPIGVVHAEGLTLDELTDLINGRERKFVDNPQVSVTLKERRPVMVHVLGDVVNPGLYSDEMTLNNVSKRRGMYGYGTATNAGYGGEGGEGGGGYYVNNVGRGGGSAGGWAGNQGGALPQQRIGLGIGVTYAAANSPRSIASLTALTAIQMAGGVKETADIRHIQLMRHGEVGYKGIDLWRLVVEGDAGQDIELRDGDTIYVPKGGKPFDAAALGWAARSTRPVRVIGEVNRPGLYYLGPDDDLFTILVKAGGFDTIAKQRYVRLSRMNQDGTVTTRVVNVSAAMRNHDKAGRASVMPGDVVQVEASAIRRLTPLIGYVGTVVATYTLLSVINAALPVTFMHNRERGNTSNSNVGFAVYGLGLLTPYLYGYTARQAAGQNLP